MVAMYLYSGACKQNVCCNNSVYGPIVCKFYANKDANIIGIPNAIGTSIL